MPRHGGSSGLAKARRRRGTISKSRPRWNDRSWEQEMNDRYVKKPKKSKTS